MNVGHPSNLARLIDLYGGQIDETGVMHKDANMEKMNKEIVSFSITDILTKETIKKFYNEHKKVLEPHGAVGWASNELYRVMHPEDNDYKSITFETADPAKFPDEIIELINVTPKMPGSLDKISNKDEFPNPVDIEKYEDFKTFLQKKI